MSVQPNPESVAYVEMTCSRCQRRYYGYHKAVDAPVPQECICGGPLLIDGLEA